MCAYILLNILNESGKRDKCEACRAFNFFFATRLINSIVQGNEYNYTPAKTRRWPVQFTCLMC